MNYFRCHNRFRVGLLLTGLLLTSCSAFNVTDLVDIVLAVKLHFRSVCVCVAHDQADGKSTKAVALFCSTHLILELNLFHIWAYKFRSFLEEKIFPTADNWNPRYFSLKLALDCCILSLIHSPASVLYVPPFRNTLFHLHMWCGQEHHLLRWNRVFRNVSL